MDEHVTNVSLQHKLVVFVNVLYGKSVFVVRELIKLYRNCFDIFCAAIDKQEALAALEKTFKTAG